MFRPNEIISMFVVCMHKCVYTGLSCCITLVKQNSLINLVIQIWGTKLKYKYEKKNPVVWITLDPPPPQSHRVIKGLTTLFLFLFTFNSTDTAEIRTPMWRRVFVQTDCYWAHICTLFPCFPNVLFPWVAWILPPALLVSQWEREQRAQRGGCGWSWRGSCSASVGVGT